MIPPPPPPRRPVSPLLPPGARPSPPAPRVETLFARAAALPPAERERLLAECAADEEGVVQEVRDLLAADAGAGDFLEAERLSPEMEYELARLKPEEAGERIGPYKLLQELGQGGFGTVWMAEQEKPVRRRVALKIIKLGMDTREVMARFEQERQALALMEHPNIARVFDAGATPFGRPFFVMELVRGVPITEYCDDAALSTRERLELFTQVCGAIQHAHQKGIIHRDIKPSNVLVTINDGEAVAKVIDFGVAKATQARLTDLTLFTQFQQMIGTPLYMSPEQAEMTSLDIDTRSDLYSLGVLLYELLTGRTPIDTEALRQAGIDEIRRLIREVDPPKPSTRFKTLGGAELTETARRRKTDSALLPAQLRGDLDWIVMRCLEKDRKRRYDSAAALALDLRRHLANEIITARPPTARYLLSKLIRRNRLAFAASAAIAVAVVTGLIVSSALYFQAKAATSRETRQRLIAETSEVAARAAEKRSAEAEIRERDAADGALAAKARAEENLRALLQRRGLEALQGDRSAEALAWFAKLLRDDPRHPTAGSVIVSILSHRNFPLPNGPLIPEAQVHWQSAQRAVHSLPDGSLLTEARLPLKGIRRWDPVIGLPLGEPFGSGELFAVSPDGAWVWTAGKDPAIGTEKRVVLAYEVAHGKVVARFEQANSIAYQLLSSDGARLATSSLSSEGTHPHLVVWNVRSGQSICEVAELSLGESRTFSPDGRFLALPDRIIDTDTGATVAAPDRPPGGVYHQQLHRSAFLQTGQTVPHKWEIFDFGGKRLATSQRSMLFEPAMPLIDPTGSRMIYSAERLNIWDLRSGEYSCAPVGISNFQETRSLAPDGWRALTYGRDRGVRVWSMVDGAQLAEPIWLSVKDGFFSDMRYQEPAWLRQGERLATPADTYGATQIWDMRDGREWPLTAQPFGLNRFYSSPAGGQLFLTSFPAAGACIFDLATFAPLGERLPATVVVDGAAFSPDGKRLAYNKSRAEIAVVDFPSGRPRARSAALNQNGSLAFSPDGRTVLVHGGAFFMVSVFDAETGKAGWRAVDSRGKSVAWLGNDAVLAGDGLLSATTGKRLRDTRRAEAHLAPDGSTLSSGTVLMDAATGEIHHTLQEGGTVTATSFSRDGRLLALGSTDGTVRLWETKSGREICKPGRTGDSVLCVAFSSDGRRIATGTRSGVLQIWEVASGDPLSLPLQHATYITQVEWLPDQSGLLVAEYGGSLRRYEFPEFPTPAPPWLARLAEMVGAHQIDEGGAAVSAPPTPFAKFRDELLASAQDDAYGQWLRWFFADRSTRKVSAFSDVTMAEARDRLLAIATVPALREAARRWPADPLVLRHLAQAYRAENDSETLRHAEFLERLAAFHEGAAATPKPE